MNQNQLLLYSTTGCHLCEVAKSIIFPLLPQTGYQLTEVDIATSDELMEKFSTAIPVIENKDSGQQLYWPFDEQQVQQLLAS